jgi:hypothetical protein
MIENAEDTPAPGPLTKEGLWARIEAATSRAELLAIADDATSVGYGPEGRLVSAIETKFAVLAAAGLEASNG